ncbi:MAG: hypothetical protein DME26_02140, partial [Verrucomicrobia bacterium]
MTLNMADAPDPVAASTPLTYTLTVHNNGPTNASAVTVTNLLPASVTFGSAISSQGTCTNSANNVLCALGPLASNATAQVEYGFTTNYEYLSPLDVTLGTNHAVLLVGLVPNTNYLFRAISRAGTNVFRSAQLNFSTDLNFVVDNPQARYGGNWTLGTSSPDKFGSSYQSAQTVSSPAPSALATYTPALPVAAKYDVYIWYPAGANRTTGAQVTIFYDGGSVLRTVNETA